MEELADHETVVEERRRSAQQHDDVGIANNALKCPAVFWIVQEMKKRSEAHIRKKKRR